MSNINRRGFLLLSGIWSLSSSLPESLSEYFGFDSKHSNYLVVFETTIPSGMSPQDYDKQKAKYINLMAIENLYQTFSEKKKILKSKQMLRVQKSQWYVLFDSKSSYYNWCYSATGPGLFDEVIMLENKFTNQNYGYRIPTELAELNIELLIEKLDNFSREPLHKTKGWEDLGDSNKLKLS